jgi:hypothetical protein
MLLNHETVVRVVVLVQSVYQPMARTQVELVVLVSPFQFQEVRLLMQAAAADLAHQRVETVVRVVVGLAVMKTVELLPLRLVQLIQARVVVAMPTT